MYFFPYILCFIEVKAKCKDSFFIKYILIMEYINDLIRRKDRLLPEDEAMILLENGECGVLSMVSPEEDVS